ncbi:MAG: DUF2156 domain-containing protein [Ruminococcaceae bacterium]|nr:DUF2156 domain-containing protein [Oscillospiraceae bacterium]
MVKAASKTEWNIIDITSQDVFIENGSNPDGIAMFGFTSLFLWKDYYNTRYSLINGNVVAKGTSDSGKNVIYFPRGLESSIKETVEYILDTVEGDISFMPLTADTAEKIREYYPDAKIKTLDGKCEYVYSQKDLALLEGKKYHAKRNHISKFNKQYESEYIEINEENLHILRECAEHLFWKIENSPKQEYEAIKLAIDNFSELKLRGCVITVDGKYVAYSIGSMINENTADIHFEKADREYDGSYAFVNNSFAKYGFHDAEYINREEDLGIEGLRKAKLSYYPIRLNQMYRISI